MDAYKLAEYLDNNVEAMIMSEQPHLDNAANMLRQQADRIKRLGVQVETQANRIAELEKEKQNYKYDPETGEPLIDGYPLYSGLPQTKHEVNGKAVPLSDEEINKAFDYYCETDEGVLRFDYELRKEWKEKELQRWKNAFARAIEERILKK